MMDIFLTNPCEWSPAPYLLFSENIWGNFIYYSHLFPSLAGLLIAIFVFLHNPRGRANQALLFMTSAFTLWCLTDLILWASDRADLIMFFWSILIHLDLLIYVGAFFFVHAFIKESRPKWWEELILFSSFIPLVLFAHTSLNLIAFDYTNCWREALEGPLWQYYVYNAELIIALWIMVFSFAQWRKETDITKKKEIAVMAIGIIAFLTLFSLGNITGSIETDWEIGQYGLFGMPVFVALLTYLIVRYQMFDVKIIATEALVGGMGILILSLMFIQKLENVFVIAFSTLILTIVLGVLLIRTVRKEVRQRKEIENLAERLEKANKRLRELDQMKSEFVSIASHQLRSPLTSIRGYASMLLEGSYGKLSQKATDAVGRIADSSTYMASSVEDYLNVSRIEAGNMKYEMMDFNLRNEAEHTADDKRPEAMKKGLVVSFKSDMDTHGIVNADMGKTKQILHNLTNNALKYTPRGTVTIFAHDDKKKKLMHVDIIDSGIGMKPEELEDIFGKFERAHNANQTNVTGTGLGLFVARKMARAMGGDVTAHSDGVGHGATFRLTMPLQM